jgi:uncharacterized membrane protein
MSQVTVEAGEGGKRRFGAAPRWVKRALIGSLAVNLLVLGLAAGAMWHVRTGQAVGGGNLYGNLVAFSQSLSANRQVELGPFIGDIRHQPELQAQRQAVRAARREMMKQFTADPFDVVAFRTAEVRVAAAEARMRELVDMKAADIAKQLTTAERAAFLKWRELRRARPRFEANIDQPTSGGAVKTP